MTKSPDPNSIRSIRRKKRNFQMSRPNRRAANRKAVADAIFAGCVKLSKRGGAEFTKAGSFSKW